MTYVAGIDGGQTSTIAVIGDETGRILGRGEAGPADEIGVGPASTRLADALRGALADAIAHARLTGEPSFAAIVAGISGYEGRVYGAAPHLPTERLVLMHDAPIAHAGALDTKPGTIVIAGTGSVVYASDGKRGRAYGGWGHELGDEGSAFWLVRESLALMMRCEDDRTADMSRETKTACEFFAQPSLRHVARAFYAGELSRHRLASFAREAVRFARLREIADRGADRLATLVRAALAAGAHPTVAYTGGMFNDKGFFDRFASGVRVLRVHLVEPERPPEVGALLLAYRESGLMPGTVSDIS